MIIKYLIEKEFKQLARNPFILFIVVALPVLVMLVFPWATTMEIKNVNVAVVDNDRSDQSRLLTEKIASTEYFDITGVFMRSEDALEQIEFGDADIILEVPYGFGQALVSEGEGSLLIEANAVNGTKASLGTSYLDSWTSPRKSTWSAVPCRCFLPGESTWTHTIGSIRQWTTRYP